MRGGTRPESPRLPHQRKTTLLRSLALACTLLAAWPLTAQADDTLARVKAQHRLACGVNTEETDYSKFQDHGDLSDLGRVVCQAVAATVGADVRTEITGFSDDPSGLSAVRDHKIDLLIGATPDPVNESAFGVLFGPPVFLDGQGFIVHHASGIATIADLAGKQVCFITETKSEQDLTDRLALRNVAYIPFPFEETGEMEAALVTGHCGAIAAPVSELADMRTGFHARKVQYDILPDTITLQPLDPVVRRDDAAWNEVVSWTVHALVLAEEANITQANAADRRAHGREEERYLLGGVPGVGRSLGLDDAWAFRVISAVGNYGEVFDRTAGPNSPMKLPRGRNALWTQGGMIYAPPLR